MFYIRKYINILFAQSIYFEKIINKYMKISKYFDSYKIVTLSKECFCFSLQFRISKFTSMTTWRIMSTERGN